MRSPTLTLLPSIGITTVTASLRPHQPRQTGSSPRASSCLASVESIASSFPTIPQDLIGLTDIKPIMDPCNYTPPATMASHFSSFSSAVNSWMVENWPKVTSVVEKCPEIKSDVDGFEKAWDFLICSTATVGLGGGSGSGGVSTTTTGGSGGETVTTKGTVAMTTGTKTTGAAGAQSTTKSGAGARETGFVGGVVAVVGIVGAVVAL